MAHRKEWVTLPKGMDSSFVSHKGDYDFPFYLSEKEEWINFKKFKNLKGKVTICEPFLIMELNRFVPYLEDKCVKFHPLNMPYIKIGKIEIMGFVVSVSEDTRFYEYQVDDGTGIMTLFFERNQFDINRQMRAKIDEKYRSSAENINVEQLRYKDCPNSFPHPRPRFSYPAETSIRDMAIFEHNWWLETNKGSLGEPVKRNCYVHAIGYCTLDFMFSGRPRDEITFRHLAAAKLTFLANKVTRVDEREYNTKLRLWLSTVVRRRYDEHPEKPEKVG
ncbi:uncharacterized protein LOC143378614 [Andrena cerasifolii]|uniref:uncharacterized protein LOC143378614 n=1 Tax=Andrena cerasifolii TaxID=2819439 RepID=UPI0040383FCC